MNRLLLFLRYPQPGLTKTRLIPAVGAIGAAQLQREIVEYLLVQLRDSTWQLEIHYTGGSLEAMQAWLGHDQVYRSQCEGDLGQRLQFGFQSCFDVDDAGCVIAIGADCPELLSTHIKVAFEQLQHHDLVLGPAADGGYYLIGLNCLERSLFEGIDWSTSRVLKQTCEKAKRSALRMTKLPVLSDIDRPEDLVIWEGIRQKMSRMSSTSRL